MAADHGDQNVCHLFSHPFISYHISHIYNSLMTNENKHQILESNMSQLHDIVLFFSWEILTILTFYFEISSTFFFLSTLHPSRLLYYTTGLSFHKQLFNCGNWTSHSRERKPTFVFHWPTFSRFHYPTAKCRVFFSVEDSPKMIVAGQEDKVTSH